MNIIGNIKDVAEVMQKAGNIELYQKILGIQEKALELVEEKARLKKEVQVLEDKLTIKESLIFKNESYWTKDGEGGPFCTHCWDTKQFTVRMIQEGNPAYMECPACKNSYCVYPEKEHKSGLLCETDEDFDRHSVI